VAVAAAVAVIAVARSGDDGPVGATPSAPSAPGVTAVPPSPGGAAGEPVITGAPADGGLPAGFAAPVDADAGAREVEAALAGQVGSVARYTFDAGPGRAMLDSGGGHALRPVVAAGGAVSFVRRGDGYAVRFPTRCRTAPAECPRAILQANRPTLFNAGSRPIRYGAAVLMTRADTGPGANVLQKGFSVGGGAQFKLQVDGGAGRPSCVLANGRKIYRLIAPVGVADGRWHNVACSRAGARLSINVDGRAVSRRVPAGLSISNSEPLRVGGKSVGPYNDQFAGRLDNVFVALY
jgi:hypothetical protein